jgi:hypothetical protein
MKKMATIRAKKYWQFYDTTKIDQDSAMLVNTLKKL